MERAGLVDAVPGVDAVGAGARGESAGDGALVGACCDGALGEVGRAAGTAADGGPGCALVDGCMVVGVAGGVGDAVSPVWLAVAANLVPSDAALKPAQPRPAPATATHAASAASVRLAEPLAHGLMIPPNITCELEHHIALSSLPVTYEE